MATIRFSLLGSLLLVISLLLQSSLGKTCSEELDCGSNIRYKWCHDGICEHCISNSDCTVNDGDECKPSGYCEIEPMFNTVSTKELVTYICIFIGAMIAAGGGLGGGGVFVPIFILIMGFDAKSAAALSQATIFGGSIINLIMNFRQQHPIRKHRTLADLPTVLIFAPLLLGGAVMGVILNQIMPDPIIVILMILILGYAAYRTFSKGIGLWKQENLKKTSQRQKQNQYKYHEKQKEAARKKQQQSQSHSKLSNHQNMDNSPRNQQTSFVGASHNHANESLDQRIGFGNNYVRVENDEDDNDTGEYPNMRTNRSANTGIKNDVYNVDYEDDSSILRSEKHSQASSQVPWLVKVAFEAGVDSNYLQSKLNQKELHTLETLMVQESEIFKPMFFILIVWCIVSFFSILRSTKLILDLDCGSVEYWCIVLGIYPCLMIITGLISRREVRAYKQKLSLYWMPCDGDIEWTPKRAILYPMVAMISGILGGLLGIGGGMIVSPLLFELGVRPRVAAATSAIAVMITSSSSLLQKYLANMIDIDYLIFYVILGMVGTFFGQTMINWLVKKSGRTSIVVFAVAIIIGSAVILMGIDGFLDLTWNFSFVSLC